MTPYAIACIAALLSLQAMAAPELQRLSVLPAYAAGDGVSATLDRRFLLATDTTTGPAGVRYRLRSLPASGQWTLDGAPLASGQILTQAQVDAGSLRFTPAVGGNGPQRTGLDLLDAGGAVVRAFEVQVDVGRASEFSVSGQAGAYGHHLWLSGDRLAVSDDNRGVSVYRRFAPTDTWVPEATGLTAPGASRYGAVALSPQWLAVGDQHFYDVPTVPGAVHLMQRDPATGQWAWVQTLTSAGGASDDSFGASVALHGDHLVVGSGNAGFNPSAPGAVYFYRLQGSPARWVQVARFDGAQVAPGLYGLGRSVALHGDRAIVGSWMSLKALIFRRDAASGAWALETVLDSSAFARYLFEFGFSVDIQSDTSGARAVVGAFNFEAFAPLGAYLFQHDPASGAWQLVQALSDTTAAGPAGYSVALDGDTVALGLPNALGGGAVALLQRSPSDGVWREVDRVANPSSDNNAQFGEAVSLDAGKLAVGADFVWDGGSRPGSVAVIDLHADARQNAAPQPWRNLGLDVPAGQTATLGSSALAWTDDGDGAPRIELTLLSLPAQAELLLRERVLRVGDRWTQADIDGGALRVRARAGAAGADAFQVQARDALGRAAPPLTVGLRLGSAPAVRPAPRS